VTATLIRNSVIRPARDTRMKSSAAPEQTPLPVDRAELSASPGEPLKLVPPPTRMRATKPKSSSLDLVTKTFQETYHTDLYESRKCGSNIRRLLEKLSDSDQLSGAKVLGIENKGFSFFGLVRARHVRGSDRNGNPRTTDMNWYHHVVLEKEGKILDYDFDTKPLTPTVDEYFQTMFFNDPDLASERKKSDYHIQVIDADEYLQRDNDTSETVTLGEYLQRRETTSG